MTAAKEFNGSARDKEQMKTAAAEGDMAALRVLLDGGADVNMDVNNEMPALIVAIQHRRTDFVKLLLERGADANAAAKTSGMTALMHAVEYHADGCLAALLAHKADVNKQSPIGETPLMLAAMRGEEHIVRLLLEHGADPALENGAGDTAQVYSDVSSDLNIWKIAADVARISAENKGARELQQSWEREARNEAMNDSCHGGLTAQVKVSRPLKLKNPEGE